MKNSLIISLIVGLTSFASASQIQVGADGIGELPTFYVYAEDEGIAQEDASLSNVGWTFEKALDLNADRVFVDVLLPTYELVQVETPAITTSLVQF